MELDKMNGYEEKELYGLSPTAILRGEGGSKPEWKDSHDRIKKVERKLNQIFIGMKDTIRLLIASSIAQQPFLMIGPPGVAKTALATKYFELLGLRRPTSDSEDLDRESRAPSPYFEYLLHSFTLPEELFGPLNVNLLRGEGGHEPRVKRMNKNMLTGPGVKATFLDEIFKANSAILNTLLTLINERRYFNDSVFHQSDLRVIVGSSNETPTIKGTGNGNGSGSGILGELRAFYDRWTIRAYIDLPRMEPRQRASSSIYAQIRDAALAQHQSRFHSSTPPSEEPLACINDLLLLGRCLMPSPQSESVYKGTLAVPPPEFSNEYLDAVVPMGQEVEHQLCTINPRKILFAEMVIRAHALLDDEGPETRLEKRHLAVLRYIWDNEAKRETHEKTVNNAIEYAGPLAK